MLDPLDPSISIKVPEIGRSWIFQYYCFFSKKREKLVAKCALKTPFSSNNSERTVYICVWLTAWLFLYNTMTELQLNIPTHSAVSFFFPKRDYGLHSHDLLSPPAFPTHLTQRYDQCSKNQKQTTQNDFTDYCWEEWRSKYILSPGREHMNARHYITPFLIYMHHSV